MSDPRDDLAALLHNPRCCDTPHPEDYHAADRVITAGWVFDGMATGKQHRAVDELTQHDQAAGHYSD